MVLREDDGYDGWLYNPDNGRTFKANKYRNRVTHYERVAGPNDRKPVVTKSKPERVPAKEVFADDVKKEKSAASEAQDALSGIVAEANATEDKGELKVLGSQIGLKLVASMNVDTMRKHIKTQVDAIASAG